MMFDISGLPQPSEPFAWVQEAAGPALVCRPLAPYARHLFTTRHWPLAGDERGWNAVAAALAIEPFRLVRTRQVHGRAVAVAERGTARVEADIMVAGTSAGDVALAVQAADCVPLLLADRRTGAVAAAHAGWRGLAARVPGAAVAAMVREYGCAPGDLVAAIGPSIGACCYEVHPDVKRRFEVEAFDPERIARWFQDVPARSSRNPSLPGLTPTWKVGRWFFDGWLAARDQLADAGVDPAQTFVAELCTASHSSLCSYRRDGARAGRLAGAIRTGAPGPSRHLPADRRRR